MGGRAGVFVKRRIRDPTPQTQQDRQLGEALLELLDWTDMDAPDSKSQAQRRRERKTFAKTIKWSGNELKHPCGIGCCNSDDEAREKIWKGLNDTFFRNGRLLQVKTNGPSFTGPSPGGWFSCRFRG